MKFKELGAGDKFIALAASAEKAGNAFVYLKLDDTYVLSPGDQPLEARAIMPHELCRAVNIVTGGLAAFKDDAEVVRIKL